MVQKSLAGSLSKKESKERLLKGTTTCFLPPPNITGALHVGHSFNHSLTDSYLRLKSVSHANQVLWVSGLDHAGIASQVVVQKSFDGCCVVLGRDVGCFAENVWEWYYLLKEAVRRQSNHFRVTNSWSRAFFTYSSPISTWLTEVFARLDTGSLIYRAGRLVNWDTTLGSVVSDLEVSHKIMLMDVWYLSVLFCAGSFVPPISLRTAEPDACCVNSETTINLAIQLVQDVFRSRLFRLFEDRTEKSGACWCSEAITKPKVAANGSRLIRSTTTTNKRCTFGIRHVGACWVGVSVPGVECGVIDLLLVEGALLALKTEGVLMWSHTNTTDVPHSSRTSTPIKQVIRRQWFLVLKNPAESDSGPRSSGSPLAQAASEAIKTRALRFIPSSWLTYSLKWLRGVSDWCLSRQLKWGHKVSSQLKQSAGDVLDTWFSSSIVPLISAQPYSCYCNLRKTMPFTALFTGYDIIRFWVLRMTMTNVTYARCLPFTTVCVHGLFCNKDGTKMSKSKGNIIDPFSLVSQFHKSKAEKLGSVGVDVSALRATLVSVSPFSKAVTFDCTKFKGSKNFCLKAANAVFFLVAKTEGTKVVLTKQEDRTVCYVAPSVCRWVTSGLVRIVCQLSKCLRRFRLDSFLECIGEFVRRKCCDKFVENIKLTAAIDSYASRAFDLSGLAVVLVKLLGVLRPIVPALATFLLSKCRACVNRLGGLVRGAPHKKEVPTKSLIDTKAETIGSETLRTGSALKEVRGKREYYAVILLACASGDRFVKSCGRALKLPEVFVFRRPADLTVFTEHSHKPFAGVASVLFLPINQPANCALGKISVEPFVPRKLLSLPYVCHSGLASTLEAIQQLGFLLRSVRYDW